MPPEQAKLKFERVEGDLHKAAVPNRVWWTIAGARNLVNYGNLDHLKKFQFPNLYDPKHALKPCALEGFAWQDGTLYVRLESGLDPNTVTFEISRPGGHSTAEPEFAKEFYCNPDTGFWVPGTGHLFSRTLANIIVKADHVVIEGLRLHMGVGAAVVVHGNEVTVRDCYMSGTHIGVFQPDSVEVPKRGSPPIGGANRTARGLTVEYCEFGCCPAYQWVRRGKWDGLYHSNLAAVFMKFGGPRSVCRHNWMHDSGNDLLEPRGNGTTAPADASEIAYNLIQNSGDDSIEFDSTTPMNLRVHHNFILEGLCLLALSPVMGGGLTIDHNILYVSRDQGLDYCALLKFGSPWGSGLPTQGARIIHNTMVNTRDNLWWCGSDHRYENMVLENNIFYVAHPQGWNLPGFVPSRHNLYCSLNLDPKQMPEVIHFKGLPFASWDPMDFSLRANSPAVDAGAVGKDYHHEARGKAPDLGAIELGDTWQFPRPGPRWAQGGEIANRPKCPRVKLDLWRPSIPRLDHPVRMAGSLDEWGKPALVLNSPYDVGEPAPGHKCGRWHGPEDLSAKVHWGWDGEAFCVAAEVTDDRHFNAQKGDMIWNGDAMQMLVGQYNMALALTDAGVAFHQFSGPNGTLRDKAEYKVVRDEKTKTTVYKLRLPLAVLGLEPGAEFDFNIVFLDDDGKGHRCWLQLAPGLCGRADANPRYVLAK